jgi:predicted DNA-binding transcriptional regulator YafY
MAGVAGRSQRTAMERLVRIAAVLKVAGETGVRADKLIQVAGFTGGADPGTQLKKDITFLQQQGWKIDSTAPSGSSARYRMVTVDNRFRVRLTPAQQTALQRAVLLADRADLVERLGLPPAERPADVHATLTGRTHDERLSTVVRAVRHRCVLRFRYGGKDRVLHPESVRSQNEHWYLRGLEDGGDVVKTFVVSRMSGVSADPPGTAHTVQAEPGLSLHPMRWQVDPPVDVVLRTTSAHLPDVERWLGAPHAVTAEGDTVETTYRVTNRSALRARLYELGLRVQLVGPEEVRRGLLDELAAVAEGAHA